MTDIRLFTSHFERDLPPAVRAVVAARGLNALGAFSLVFLSPLLVQERGASLAETGWTLAAFGAATLPSRLLGGRLADRHGPRPVMVAGLLGCAAAQLAIAVAPSLPTTVLAVVLLGLAFEIYEPASQAMISLATHPEQRASAFAALGAALSVAGILAGLIGAALAGLGLRWLFVVDAATCLGCAATVAALLPATPSTAARQRASTPAVTSPWRDCRLLALLGAGTVFATAYLEVPFALPLALSDRGMAPAWLGLLLTVSGVAGLAALPVLRRGAVGRLDHHRALALGYGVLAMGLLGLTLAQRAAGFVAATILCAIGEALLLGHTLALVTRLAPEGGHARYLAAYGLSWGIAAVLAPLVGAALLHRGPGSLWSTTAAAIGLLGVTHLVTWHRRGVR